MHEHEFHTDEDLVHRLISAQCPQWSDLRIERVASSGTDNALYRLGDDLVVRLPRIEWARGGVEKEYAWLPRLAPHLPLSVPTPLFLGEPAEGYPWRWMVATWLEGETAAPERIADAEQFARDLAGFIRALQRIDAREGPPAGEHNHGRGEALVTRDAAVRRAVEALGGTDIVDLDRALAAWDQALAAPAWSKPPVWIHGDLHPGNLIVRDGRLVGAIDFGCVGVGDPACELVGAWDPLLADVRDVYRESLAVDDATWVRGRGWALSWALISLPYYFETNPFIVDAAKRTLAQVLAD